MRNRRKSLKNRTTILVKRKGYFTIRELCEYLGLKRITILRYMGKYGEDKLEDFPVRENIGGEWAVRIYDIYVWLGRIEKGQQISDNEMIRVEKFVNLERAGEILEYSYLHILLLCRAGKIPAYKSKKKWLFLPSELEQWNIDMER